MVKIRLPDNSELEVEQSTPAVEIAKRISHTLSEDALAAKVDGKILDLNTPITSDCEIRFLTFDDPDGRTVYWHSSSHLMAHAIQSLFPEAKF